jgi:hypothetical protein
MVLAPHCRGRELVEVVAATASLVVIATPDVQKRKAASCGRKDRFDVAWADEASVVEQERDGRH